VGGYARRCLGVLDSLWLSESVRARVTLSVCVCVCVLLVPFEYLLKVEHTEVRAYILRIVWTRRGLRARAYV
jgi:hypothetical protein